MEFYNIKVTLSGVGIGTVQDLGFNSPYAGEGSAAVFNDKIRSYQQGSIRH